MYYLTEGSAESETPHIEKLGYIPSKSLNTDKLPLFIPEVGVAKWFFSSGMAEKSLIQWSADTFCKPDKVFLDIGAHVGTYSLVCGRVSKHTYSFECGPTTFCFLAANLALHELTEKVTPMPYALGNKEGPITYIVRSKDGGGNGVLPLTDADKLHKTTTCTMRTLDSFRITDVGFIKIDVEGFEKQVLEGATETLRINGYPPILFESWGEWKEKEGVPANKIREELFAYLVGLGYTIMPIRGYSDMFLASKP